MHACFRDLYAKRRAHLVAAMAAGGEPAIAVLPAAPTYVRNNDVDHEYRQDSDLFYLTGFDEPQSVLVLTTEPASCVLFVRPRDPEREVWDGPRAGVDGAKAEFGADEAFTIDKLEAELPKLLSNKRRLYYRLGRDRAFDDRVLDALEATRRRARTGIFWPTDITDPGSILHEMRLVKGSEDLDAMRTAARITRDAHLRAMAHTRPGMHEYEVEALLLETFRKNGSERPAYGSIVGSGANATVLHYRANNRKMEDGDLLLIDAGCEFGYYASDVTRTFPVSGKFSEEQRAIYQIVLDAQIAGIEATRAGATLEEVHKKSVDVITRGLRDVGILQGRAEGARREGSVQAVLHAPDQPLARHGRARRRLVLRRQEAARPRRGDGAHRRAGHLHPEERREGRREVARHRRAHRGRHPRHEVGAGESDGGHSEVDRRDRRRLRVIA